MHVRSWAIPLRLFALYHHPNRQTHHRVDHIQKQSTYSPHVVKFKTNWPNTCRRSNKIIKKPSQTATRKWFWINWKCCCRCQSACHDFFSKFYKIHRLNCQLVRSHVLPAIQLLCNREVHWWSKLKVSFNIMQKRQVCIDRLTVFNWRWHLNSFHLKQMTSKCPMIR